MAIGETEKNLRRFDAAERGALLLLSTGGRALVRQRSEAGDSHDRWPPPEAAIC